MKVDIDYVVQTIKWTNRKQTMNKLITGIVTIKTNNQLFVTV